MAAASQRGSSPLTRGKHLHRHPLASRRGLIPAHAGKTRPRYTPRRTRRAHPRSRGENASDAERNESPQGSSPLTRGKRGDTPACPAFLGLIPAHAGKTSDPASWCGRTWAHPRSRGENPVRRRRSCCALGSSPLTRGKQQLLLHHGIPRGLIPAHAGKTRGPGYGMRVGQAPPRSREENSSDPWRRQRSRAHPHSRGENPKVVVFDNLMDGSSPLTRGKPIRVLAVRGDLGLIPAHTGKTGTGCPSSPHPWAHPHSRGENAISMIKESQTAGSSPLTRGKLVHHRHDGLRARLIPAHAGKTASTCIARLRGRAHPRSHGENFHQPSVTRLAGGSSPLTRGKHRAVRRAGRQRGLIPAHARKTRSSRCPARATSAHPRSHGENRNTSAFRPLRTGSSPLTRGKPD